MCGTLSKRSQVEVQINVEVRGGTFRAGVSKKTSLLIAGARANLDKAKALGVPILTEAAFEEMLAKVPATPEMRAKYLS